VTDVLDRAALRSLLEMVGDDPEFVGELVDEYLADAPVQLEAMRAAVAAGDPASAARPAHTLKGTSSNLGAMELAAACRKIEERARAGAADGLMELVASAGAAYERAVAELGAARARDWRP